MTENTYYNKQVQSKMQQMMSRHDWDFFVTANLHKPWPWESVRRLLNDWHAKVGSSAKMIDDFYYHQNIKKNAEVFAGPRYDLTVDEKLREEIENAGDDTSDEELAARITAQVMAAIKAEKNK